MAQFKTTTPRVISVCLDLNENKVKFWLNDRRNTNKSFKLPEGGLWIPCVQIEKEKNKIYLNPFAREPSDFYEKDYDKKLNINKFILPHLHNMVCVTKLPQMSTVKKEAANSLRELLQLNGSQLYQILLPEFQETKPPPDNEWFCFIQFHHYGTMGNFVRKIREEKKFEIWDFYDISKWYTTPVGELAAEVKGPFQLIQEMLKLPKCGVEACLNSIDQAFLGLKDLSASSSQGEVQNSDVKIVSQPYTDKMICLKDNTYAKLLSRDPSTMSFDIEGTSFSETPIRVDQSVLLKVRTLFVTLIFQAINWSQIFKEENQENAFGVIQNFFQSFHQTKSVKGNHTFFRVPLVTAKYFLDIALQQTQAQLDRVRRNQNNFQTPVPVDSIIPKNKPEYEHELVKRQSFYQDHNHSVEDLYMLKQVITDLQEQIWAIARSSYCPPIVKSLLQSTSRPFSSLNRLGSFISLDLNLISAQELSENGFFYRESQTISQFQNQFIELSNLNLQNLSDYDILEEYLGKNNRFLKSLISENVPLYKSLNYLPAQNVALNKIIDIISSQNSEFLLCGDGKGNVKVCGSSLQMNTLLRFNFFDRENDSHIQKFVQFEDKLKLELLNYDTFKEKLFKRSVPLSVLKDFKQTKTQEQNDKTEMIKAKKEAKKIAKAAQKKKISKSSKQALVKEKKKQLKASKSKYPLEKVSYLEDSKEPSLTAESSKEPEEIEKLEFTDPKQEPNKPITEHQVKVLGYTLLSKPAHQVHQAPLIIGCIFQNIKTQKFYIRIRQLAFTQRSISSQFTNDQQTGHLLKRINGKYITESIDMERLAPEILMSRENMLDLIPTFLRDQHYGDNLPRNSSFNMFTPLHSAELEIPCLSIIDFTRCSYSIENQHFINIVGESNNEQQQLVPQFIQLEVKWVADSQSSIQDIKISQNAAKELGFKPLRVFQIEDKFAILGQEKLQIYQSDKMNLENEISIPFKVDQDERNNFMIVNATNTKQIFNKKNIKKFVSQQEQVPQQKWNLIYHNAQKQQQNFLKFDIVGQQQSLQQQEQVEEQKIEKQDSVKSIQVENYSPQDILQLGNLLQCKYQGTIAQLNNDAYLTSSNIDNTSQLFTHHSWNLINNKNSQHTFGIQIPCSDQQTTQVREIDIEFSFKRKQIKDFKMHENIIRDESLSEQQDQLDQSKQLQKIPLTTEYIVGAQLNDHIQPCFMTAPDSKIFQANYSQPEMIFKHQQNELFVPTQIIIRSKENREYNGVPIAQGLLFISESLEPLLNTKQFAKFTEKEYLAWKSKRDQHKDLPLLPHEPVAFFDIGEDTQIKVNLQGRERPCRYIKFIPTAFRKKPINFSSKPFNATQAECQFFGVNGYILENHQRGIFKQENFGQQQKFKNDLVIKMNCDIEEAGLGSIGQIQEVQISELRGAKASQMSIPVSALGEMKVKNVIGVAKTQYLVREEHSNKISGIRLNLGVEENEMWEVQGVTVSVKSFEGDQIIFKDQWLQKNKSKIRHNLLEPKNFEVILEKMIIVSQDQKVPEETKLSCLESLVRILNSLRNDKNYSEFLKLFRSKTDLSKLLSDQFLDLTPQFQSALMNFTEQIQLLESNTDLIETFIQNQLSRLLTQQFNPENIQSLLSLIQSCKPPARLKINKSISDLLFDQICGSHLSTFQSEAFIILRSKLGLNSFILDTLPQTNKPNSNAISQQQQSCLKTIANGQYQFLNCNFEVYKMNNFYSYKIELEKVSMMQKLKLYFENENKCLYKINVRVIVPGVDGGEEVRSMHVFDENVFTQVCDLGHQGQTVEYFNSPVENGDGSRIAQSNLVDKSDLNCLTLDINGYLAKYLKIQIELMDTYRTVQNKQTTITQMFIRPELYGSVLENSSSSLQPTSLDSFTLTEPTDTSLMGQKSFDQLTYSIHKIDKHSFSHKSALFILNNTHQSIQSEDPIDFQALQSQQDKIKQQLLDFKKGLATQSEIKEQVQQLQKQLDKQNITFLEGGHQLNLSYIFKVSDILAQHLNVQSNLKTEILKERNFQQDYQRLFKHFTIFDQKNLHQGISTLQDYLFKEIKEKNQFIIEIYNDFLMSPSHRFSQKGILEFIKSQSPYDFNQLFSLFLKQFKFDLNEIKKMENIQDFQKSLEEFQERQKDNKGGKREKIPIQQIIVLLRIMEMIQIQKEQNQKVDIGIIFRIVAGYLNSVNVSKIDDEKKNLLITYAFNVVLMYLQQKVTLSDNCIQNSLSDLLFIVQMVIQQNNKQSEKIMKLALKELMKLDKDGHLLKGMNILLQWYQNKENMNKSLFYQGVEKEQQGLGTGQFFKHLSIVFKIYMKLLNNSTQAGSVSKAYSEMGLSDMLSVLVVDKDSENYEENYGVVWVQIYESLYYLNIEKLKEQSIFETIAKKFFSLSPLLQHSLYPKLHHLSERIFQQPNPGNPLILILLAKAFLNEGFKSQENIKVTYCFTDGIFNILLTSKKDEVSQESVKNYLTTECMRELFEMLSHFLFNHVNIGVFNGMQASHVETIMKLDIATQMTTIINNAKISKENEGKAFAEYVQKEDIDKTCYEMLVDWLFINYSPQKGKNSPAGSRSYTLSVAVEQILFTLSQSEKALSLALPILMDKVLLIDEKIRNLTTENQINLERSVQIQKNVNILFLNLFKSWVQTDAIAKKFLMQLNGFDFLLNRLFTQNESETLTEDSDLVNQINSSEEELSDIEDEELMNQIKSKIFKSNINDKEKPIDKKKSKSQAQMKKQSSIKDGHSKPDDKEKAQKDLEQALQIEDFARTMKIIWSSDKEKAVGSVYMNLQWNKFKNGAKNKIYNYQITKQQHQYEYVVKFELEQLIQINELQVGVLYNWSSYDQDLQYVPQTFIVEGGRTQDESEWKIELQAVNDDGYKLNTITVYGHNFIEKRNVKGGSLNDSIQSIGCKECKYLTFRLRKPLMACLDSSLYVGSASKIKSYCFSFISVMGTKVIDQPILPYILDMQKENSLEVLSKFFSGEFTEAFQIISEQPQIIVKIKNAFDKLSSLLDSKAQLIKPIFLAICYKNKELGDWIMEHRLISIDDKLIRKEQIKFLGDIISSNFDEQLDKLEKLKSFIINEINLNVEKNVTRNNDQRVLLSRFIKLYNKKMREYAILKVQNTSEAQNTDIDSALIDENLNLQPEIKMKFTIKDLENSVSLMSQFNQNEKGGKNTFVKSLISFNLLLLTPPAPFTNTAISTNDYVEKLLATEKNQLSNLLFCSIIGSTNLNALQMILKKEKVQWVLSELQKQENNDSQSYQLAQIIYNLSKQNKFKEEYRKTITFDFYNLLKLNQPSQKLLNDKLSESLIELIVQTIKDIVIGGPQEEEDLTILLKEDMVKASESGDVDFINKVIVPILHAEQKLPISINLVENAKNKTQIKTIFSTNENQQTKGQQFFLKTDILSQSQKQSFNKSFKEISSDKVDNFKKMLESKWECIYEDKNLTQDTSKFRKFVQAVQNKSNVILLAHCNLNGQKVVFGGFCSKAFPTLGDTWAHEFDYQVPFAEGNFVFYYTNEKNLHFTMLHSKPFGYIYTDYEEGGALSISGDFFLISWSYEFQNSCGNIYDMKCIEEPSIMTFYSNMEVQDFEVWWCNTGVKADIEDGKVKSELKRHICYKEFSPFNFFRENLIFEVNAEMNLSQVAREILGKAQVFIKYPNEDEIPDKTLVEEFESDSMDGIIDLYVKKQQESQKSQEDKEEEKNKEETKLENINPQIGNLVQSKLMNYSFQNTPIFQPSQVPISTPGKMYMSGQPPVYPHAQIMGGSMPINTPQLIQDDLPLTLQSSIDMIDLSPKALKPVPLTIKQTKVLSSANSSNKYKRSRNASPSKRSAFEDDKKIPPFIPNQPILKIFEEKGGIFDLIKAAKVALKQYNHEKIQEMWSLWLSEIESFSQLPSFFSTFCQDHDKETIIYNLLDGKYDIDSNKQINQQDPAKLLQQQEELHIDMVKYSYKIVNQVFEKHLGADLREQCLKNGTLEKFIERVGQLSSEKRRQKVTSNLTKEDSQQEKEGNSAQKSKTSNKKENNKNQRKGVGYTTGVGTTWNVSEYLKSKEAKNAQISNIVSIIKHFIRTKDWEAPPEIKELLLESAMLPTLEAAFRSGSLLEMAKDFELNISYLEFVKEIAQHHNLLNILLDIGEQYEPKQKESVQILLEKLQNLSKIFLSCLTSDQKNSVDENTEKPKKLALKIEETYQIVMEKVQQQESKMQKQTLKEILSMPVEEAYRKLLADMRFENMSMKDSVGILQHYYQSEVSKNQTPTTSKLVRLAQEIADLSNSLPCHATDAIFCRVDKERVDLMKVMIMGASGTPYAHGAFIYDLFFDNSYPQTPPKCQLMTTGGQTVRFNPNLYHNGKVCLSLLGTWRGSATENWDAKLSTILQVLLSIQAIIMSNEVYFNEPGYEHEAGTPEGERKNEGYANIVRYCNIKFAMIEQIKNPPAGFEKVIRRSFYLKKNDILREVREWTDKAKKSDALYTGLVYDHNYQWAPQISQEGKYAEMMENIYKELQTTLESLQSPFEDEAGLKLERRFSKMAEAQNSQTNVPQQADLTQIDVSYEPDTSNQIQQQQISVEDDKVKDRWSRYIGAMGIEAVAKQAQSKIMIHGIGALGVEIAKNIVLAGCKELILNDTNRVEANNWQGNFFLSEQDVGLKKQRAELCKEKIQQLNYYVKVSVVQDPEQIFKILKEDKELKVLIITETFHEDGELVEINELCRSRGIAFIMGNQQGLFGQVFNDFGDEFVVLDKNGEELQEVVIKDITNEEEGIVTLLEGYKHTLEDGDQIQLQDIEGMLLKDYSSKSINSSIHTIKVINPHSFKIENTLNYTKFEKGGIAKQIKVPKKMLFKSLKENMKNKIDDVSFDPNMLMQDFEKMDNIKFAHQCFEIMNNLLNEQNLQDITLNKTWKRFEKFMKSCEQITNDMEEEQKKKFNRFAQIFAITYLGNLPPLCAYLGGFIAQEAIKAITQKFSPIHQFLYCDCIELFPITEEITKDNINQLFAPKPKEDTQSQLRLCLGSQMIKTLAECNLFMVGAGAIGCELLKNYAMLSIGTDEVGKIILTDPDIIEVSNLNRQFLFREKHLRKSKSATAAAAAIQMNPKMKGHIEARMDKVCEATKGIYDEKFFQSQTVITNALDNVQARMFIDNQCVTARVAMVDSGTLGPKGHVQIVMPLETESYASQRDPEDNTSIPQCTLKMFPEETLHCVELAKDIFGNMFTLNPQSYNKVVIEEAEKVVNFGDQQELIVIKKIIKLVEKKPLSFDDCVKKAREKFHKYFCNDIKQLLHVYPKDKVEKNGKPFWSLPKRAPIPIEFDNTDPLHSSFISSLACLYATIYKISIPYDHPRSNESKSTIGEKAKQYEMPVFKPNDQKASQIASEVEKQNNKDQQQEEQKEEPEEQKFDVESIKKKFEEFIKPLKSKPTEVQSMQVEEFEKDNDENYHVDFIYSFANIRAANYSLNPMDWLTVKLKAGRIIPALATTTAAIAGLQTLELLKYLSSCKVSDHRNSFLNLAVPSLMMSEPGAPVKTKIKEGLEVTIWDRWEYDADQQSTLSEVLIYLESQFKLESRDVFHGSVPVIIHALGQMNKEKLTKKTLRDVLEVDPMTKFVDLTVTFVDPEQEGEMAEKIITGIPPVRVYF